MNARRGRGDPRARCAIPVQLGGGIRDMRTVEGWLAKGVARVIIGTAAVRDPGLRARGGAASSRAGSRSASTPRTAGSRSRAGRRPRRSTAEDLGRRFEDAGVAAIVYTDIARDGILKGLNIPMTLALARAVVDPGHRLGRPRLAWPTSSACSSPTARSSPAPSRAARSMTGGSTRREALALLRAARGGRPPDAEGPPHPLPRREGRPRRQGRAVRRPASMPATRSRPPRPMTRPAPTSSASSTSPRATRTAASCSTSCARTAEACFMPLTVGGGVRTRRGHPRAAARRRRQGLDQHRRRARPATSSREAAEKFGDQCIVVAIDAKRVSAAGRAASAGRSSPMAAATRPASTRSRSRSEVASARAPASSSSPRWTATAPRPATTSP